MKVGTDSVLLGAWVHGGDARNILDLGTGTGILALMMAQRFAKSKITALEVNKEAYDEAQINVDASPWSDRIDLKNGDIANYNPSDKFDLILANPPYFQMDLRSAEKGKAMARHASKFDVKDFASSSRWLRNTGVLAGIYPKEIYEKLKAEMESLGFFANRILKVHPTPQKDYHRVVFEFSRSNGEKPKEECLVIESDGRHQYSDEYKSLTADFYLNF